MIKHIVMWKLKEAAENRIKSENAAVMKELLEGLESKINEIKYIEVGLNISNSESAYDIMLYSEFEDMKSLEKYLEHPEHKKVSDYISKIRDKRISIDYKY